MYDIQYGECMTISIFFSWQADRSTRVCRNLQERALERAIESMGRTADLQNANREDFVLDRDTKDEPGSPPVAATIFTKIDAAAVFVPDFTFVGLRPDGRSTPNPNVLVEYGWALKALGYRRIVPIMNTAYGGSLEIDLPFDLRHHRHPITYHCPEDADEATRKSVREQLVKELKYAIGLVVSSHAINTPIANEPAAWKSADQRSASVTRLIRLDSLGGEEEACPRLTGPKLELSIRPRRRKSMKVWELVDRLDQLKLELPLFGRDTSSRLARNEYGVCRYVVNTPAPTKPSLARQIADRVLPGQWVVEPEPSYDAFTQIYPDGEMWLVDCAALRWPIDEEIRPINPDIEQQFVSILDRARAALRHFGSAEPYDVVATILGIGSRVLPLMDKRGGLTGRYTPKTDEIEITSEFSVENELDASLDCLMPLFDALWESVHSKRPSYYDQLAVQKIVERPDAGPD
jgi:hypothetical protein